MWSLYCGMDSILHPSFTAARLLSLTHVTLVCLRSLCLQQAAINKSCFAHYPCLVIGQCLWNWSALCTSSPKTPPFCPSPLPRHHPFWTTLLFSSLFFFHHYSSSQILMPLLDHIIKFELLCQEQQQQPQKTTIFCGLQYMVLKRLNHTHFRVPHPTAENSSRNCCALNINNNLEKKNFPVGPECWLKSYIISALFKPPICQRAQSLSTHECSQLARPLSFPEALLLHYI